MLHHNIEYVSVNKILTLPAYVTGYLETMKQKVD